MSTTREEIYSKLHPFLEDLVDIACDNIEKIEKDNGWISVKDRLPDTGDNVLITYKCRYFPYERDIAITSYEDICIGGHSVGRKGWISPFDYFKCNYDIVAWKPLPDVYDGE